jgi:hypothetical protein
MSPLTPFHFKPDSAADKLARRLDESRAQLRARPLAQIAAHSGSTRLGAQLQLDFMWREYRVDGRDWIVVRADSGEAAPSFIEAIVLAYLAAADGTPPLQHWISFHELPDGQFYEQAFRSYTGEELVRGLKGDVDAFKRAALKLHGRPIGLAEAAFAFQVLPRLQLAIVMYAGDEDFPAQARVLFEATAPHYLSTDGLAILGGQLVSQLLKAAQHA